MFRETHSDNINSQGDDYRDRCYLIKFPSSKPEKFSLNPVSVLILYNYFMWILLSHSQGDM